jgi:hypothetical protein
MIAFFANNPQQRFDARVHREKALLLFVRAFRDFGTYVRLYFSF